MNSIHTLLNHPLVESTGWALIHFLWQGAVIAAVIAALLVMMRRASSDVKYVVCCLGLLLMAIGPLLTTAWLMPVDARDTLQRNAGESGLPETTQTVNLESAANSPDPALADASEVGQRDRERRVAEVGEATAIGASPANTSTARASDTFAVSIWLETRLDWFLTAWAVGVVLLSVRLLLCWLNVGRLSRSGTDQVSEQVASLFADLSNRVGVSRGVRLLESTLVQVPTVLGALQPVILLPATAVTGLSSSQLQAILAHELAHVRRHDYLVNLLQTAIETLLFYHPAVWWLSRRIRQERENCCDDVASLVCGNRLEYAQALVRMEEVRATTPRLAVASTGGSLTQRVRRLIGAPVQPPHEGRRGWWLGGVIPIALLLFAASCISKVATDGPDGDGATSGPDDTYVVVWGVVVDRDLADQLLAGATKFDEQEGWALQTIEAARLRERLHKAADSNEIIRLYQRMNWLAPLSINMPPEHLTGTLTNGDNVQFREPGDRAHILFTQDIIGVHRVLPADDHVRLKLQTQHSARFEAFNTTEGDVESEHRGQIDTDHRIPNGDAMLVTRVLDPLLDWSPVVISVFEPVRVPSRRSQQRQIHDLPTWLAAGPQGIQRRAKAANNWSQGVATKTVPLAGKWSQLLESGSRVTLVGLSSPQHCPTAWWTPDGMPLQFDFDPNVTAVPPHEMIALLHVVHTPGTQKAPDPVNLKTLINPTSSLTTGGVRYLSGSERTAMPNPADGQLVIVSVPAGDEPTLEVGLGTGMQPDQHLGVVKRDEPLLTDAGEFRAAQVLKRKLHTFGEVTDVSMRHPREREHEVLVTAVTSDGDKLTSQYLPRVHVGGNTSTTASVFDRFLVHPDQVTHFEIATARLAWATFSGFVGFPAALREQLTAAAEEPTPVLALVGWTFQGDETAFKDLLNGAEPQNLGDRLSWFLNDSESVRRQYMKLRDDGHADPPGVIVGALFDFDQFMKISAAGAYRGPVLGSFPFGYSSGILDVQERKNRQGGMWTLEANVALSSAKDRAWQIGGRWLVQENKPNAAGRSQWSDVFDQKLKLATKLPPGRVAVFTGPVPGMDESDRTGFVVLECIPIPHTQVMKVRGLDKDVEKVLRQGPLMALAALDVPESPAESDEKPKSGVTVRGRVLDHTARPLANATVFPLGSTYGRRHSLMLTGGKAVRRAYMPDQIEEDKLTLRVYTDKAGRFELKTRNTTELAVTTPELDVWEVSAPKQGDEAVIRLPQAGTLVVGHDLDEVEAVRVFVSGPVDGEKWRRNPGNYPQPLFRCSTQKVVELKRGASSNFDAMAPGEYVIGRAQRVQRGNFQRTYILDRTVVKVESGKVSEYTFTRPTGARVDLHIKGAKEQGVAWSVITVQLANEFAAAPLARGWMYVDAGLTTTERFETGRLSKGAYRVTVYGYRPSDDDKKVRNLQAPGFVGEATVTVPESGDVPVIEVALREIKQNVTAVDSEREQSGDEDKSPEDKDAPGDSQVATGSTPADAPAVSIRGRVLDAESGEPITKFITQAGKFDPKDPTKVQWGFSQGSSGAAREGRFSTTIRWKAGWTSRILADGYLPQPVVTKAPKDGQTSIEVELRMKRGRWVRGRVIDHTGKPAEGVSVFAVDSRGINLGGGRAHNSNRVRAMTDKSGRFELVVGEASRLALSSPDIDAWHGELPEDMQEATLTLPEPGRVVINFDIEGAGEKTKVFRQLLGNETPGFKGITSEQTVEMKNGETLEIASLPPGKYQIARSRMLRTGNMGMGRFLDRHWLSIEAGQTVTIDFTRPKGARVKGLVAGLKDTKAKTALVTVMPLKLPDDTEKRFKNWLVLDGQTTDENGVFTTEKLPPGEYRFIVEVYLPLTPQEQFRSGRPTPKFTGEAIVLVPETGSVPDIEIPLKERAE